MASGQGYCRLYSMTTSGKNCMSNILQVNVAFRGQAGHKSVYSCIGITQQY
jgi:hypothetical protein